MRRSIHLKKKKKISKIHFIVITFLVVIVGTFITLYFLSSKITPILLETAEVEIRKISLAIINKSISPALNDKINSDELFHTQISSDGSIQTIDFNSIVVNQILDSATTLIHKNMKLLEEGKIEEIGSDFGLQYSDLEHLRKGIVANIPIGIIYNNPLLSNLGPKIPIRIRYMGNLDGNITTKVNQYGINNALVEIGIHLEMTAMILLPFPSGVRKMTWDIPVIVKIIQGNIPNYYSNGFNTNSGIMTIPME